MLNIEVEILPREMGSCIQMFCAVTHCLHCFIVLVLVKELDASYILSTHTLPLSCTAVSLYADLVKEGEQRPPSTSLCK